MKNYCKNEEDVYIKFNELNTMDLDIRILELGIKKTSKLKYEKSMAYGQDGYTKISEDAFEGFERTSVLMTNSEESYSALLDVLYIGCDVRVEYSDDNGKHRFGTISDIEDDVIIGENRRIIVTVDLQPFVYDEETTLVNPTQINNIGNIYTNPIIEVFGTGEISLKIGDNEMILNVDDSVLIDNDTMDIFDSSGNRANSRRISGDFFKVQPGISEILTNATINVIIEPRWR